MKCITCGREYGINQVPNVGAICKKCENPLELEEFWSSKDIQQDLEFAISQPCPLILVAENDDGLCGFTWGYQLPFEKFPFLDGKIIENSSYMDEIAVRGNKRLKGIGMTLGREYLQTASNQSLDSVVLRTDETNVASMTLFKKLGFVLLDVRDPEF